MTSTNKNIEVRVERGKDPKRRNHLVFYRYDKSNGVDTVEDWTRLLTHISPNDELFTYLASFSFFIPFITSLAACLLVSQHGVLLGIGAAILTVTAFLLTSRAILRTKWAQRITKEEVKQFQVSVSSFSTYPYSEKDVVCNDTHEATIDVLKRVVKNHHNVLVDISDTLEELNRVKVSHEIVSKQINESIQHLVNIEHNISVHRISKEEADAVIASAKEKMNATASMLGDLEEDLKELN